MVMPSGGSNTAARVLGSAMRVQDTWAGSIDCDALLGELRDRGWQLTPIKRLRWHRNTDTPARMYESEDGRFTIIWDPAGSKEGEPGGWYLHDSGEATGIYRLLAEAKVDAEDRARDVA